MAKMREKRKKGGGGKLSRSEVVTVRLDQKLLFSARLAAVRQRRTLSSFIEWATQEALSRTLMGGQADETAAVVADKIWDVNEGRRFINQSTKYPETLTPDEAMLWRFIEDVSLLKGKEKGDVNIGLVGAFFAEIKACHESEITRASLEETLQGALQNEDI